MNTKILLGALLLTTAAATADAQVSAPLPGTAAAPLLYVRFVGPAGSQVTFAPGTPEARRYGTPTTVGLRPGYRYRVQLSNLPELPGLDLYPTLEVRGSLRCSSKINPANHPAIVSLDERDLAHIRSGALLTKVIYLEHPDRALPVASKPDQLLVTDLRAGQDPLEHARTLGRPVLIVHVGQRAPAPAELAHGTVPGTLLLPGEMALSKPAAGPCLPWDCVQLYDPILGPKKAEEECLRDGGDAPPQAGFGPGGALAGVDPADTVAEYVDSSGKRHIAVSNPVCVCVPRFAVVRSLLLPVGYETLQPILGTQGSWLQLQIKTRQPSLTKEQTRTPAFMVGRERPSENENVVVTAEIEKWTRTAIIMARSKGREIVGMPVEKACQPDCPLVLRKSVDRDVAQVGDVVTFTLRYANPGGNPMTDVAVVDSLTGRLEYVPGSQKSDRAATFTLEQNEAGSVKLRWTLPGKLLPGESGVITFQAKIR